MISAGQGSVANNWNSRAFNVLRMLLHISYKFTYGDSITDKVVMD